MGIISGKLADKVNQYVLALSGTLLAEIGLVISLLAFFLENYTVCFLMGFSLGLSDCFFNNVVSIICSKDYEGHLEIFAVFRFNLSLGAVISFGTSIILEDTPQYIFILIVFAF